VLRTLTHLTLGNNPDRIQIGEATGTKVEDLLAALAHMSLLQELVIDGVLLSPAPEQQRYPLPLPMLSCHTYAVCTFQKVRWTTCSS